MRAHPELRHPLPVPVVGAGGVARSIGGKTRKSLLGPVDRLLGGGFGMIKGLLGATRGTNGYRRYDDEAVTTVRQIRALLAAGESFDIVVSNHVLHHLDAAALRGFTDDSLALSRGSVLHADIARGRLAYGLYAVGIAPLSAGTFLRVDGLRSIRRSYRAPELAAALGGPWRVQTPAPFRVLAVARGEASRA